MVRHKRGLTVRIAVLGLWLLTVGAGRTLSATWYVERDATGANNGTSWANAWNDTTSINWASLSPGDTVYISGGTSGKTYSAFSTGKGGTAGNPITLKWSAEAGHNGLVTLASVITIQHPYVILDGVSYTNMRFNAYSTVGQPTYGSLSVLSSGDYFQLRNVSVIGNRGAGFGHSFGSKANHITIHGCLFDNTAYEDQIYFDVMDGWLILENSIFRNNISGDPAVHRDCWNAEFGSGGWDLTVRGCMFIDMDDVFLLQNKGARIGTITFAYNVCWNNHFTLRFGSGNLGANRVNVYNNIFYNTLGTDLNNVTTTDLKNNFYQSGSSFVSDTGGSMDPLFLNPNSPLGADGVPFTADDGFNIRAGSPAIHAGVNVGETKDILGNPIAGNPDLGAYEYGTVSTNPVISVSPANLNFGLVQTNTSCNLIFTVQNVGVGTLGGTASVAAPFSVISGGTYGLGANQSQPVTVRYSPTAAGSNSQQVTFTGGGGATATVSGLATITNGNLPPTVSTIGNNAADVDPFTPGLQIFESTTVQYSGSAADPNGDPLTWQWIYTVNGGAEVVYRSGTGTVASISFYYPVGTVGRTYVWKLRANDGQASTESQLTVGVIAPLAVGAGASFEAESGVISTPFVIANGSISQPSTTGITDGGRATYAFTITNAGNYVIQALVNAPSLTGNSFYVNIDAEPQDPSMTWDILPPTVGFENRLVGWRGNGTADANEIVPKIFSLTQGSHQLIIRGREANAQLDRFTFIELPEPPQNLRIVPLP